MVGTAEPERNAARRASQHEQRQLEEEDSTPEQEPREIESGPRGRGAERRGDAEEAEPVRSRVTQEHPRRGRVEDEEAQARSTRREAQWRERRLGRRRGEQQGGHQTGHQPVADVREIHRVHHRHDGERGHRAIEQRLAAQWRAHASRGGERRDEELCHELRAGGQAQEIVERAQRQERHAGEHRGEQAATRSSAGPPYRMDGERAVRGECHRHASHVRGRRAVLRHDRIRRVEQSEPARDADPDRGGENGQKGSAENGQPAPPRERVLDLGAMVQPAAAAPTLS
jgi:hypothetical protein